MVIFDAVLSYDKKQERENLEEQEIYAYLNYVINKLLKF